MTGALAQALATRGVTGHAADCADEALLEQFLNGTSLESQEAFRTLVARHGPMVLGTCRHVLGEHHDAEDAFQATFLVLARKGATIRNRRVLAGWLHEVAHRIAVKARASALRRRDLEKQCATTSARFIERDDQDQTAAWNELRPLLHAEVERLPERYRMPVILSYLEGKTNEEVAALLQWPVGTVKGRLSRARDLLRSRLVRRGLSLSAAFVLAALSHQTVFAEAVPAELAERLERRILKRAGRKGDPPAATEAETSRAAVERVGGGDVMRGARTRPRFFRLVPILLVVLGLSAVGGLASAAAGGDAFAGVRAAIASLGAAWTNIFHPPCH
jgi:RNA polymerase sigma factor (sigma-70 family)